jgi:hypothetical protein
MRVNRKLTTAFFESLSKTQHEARHTKAASVKDIIENNIEFARRVTEPLMREKESRDPEEAAPIKAKKGCQPGGE